MKKISVITTTILFCILSLLFIGCDEVINTPGGPDDASLSALSISSGTLTPEFISATTEYSVTLESGTTSMTITPTAANPASVIKVDGTVTASGEASAAVSLAEGLNTIVVEVTSEDGSTVKKYTLQITVGAAVTVKISGTLTLSNSEDAAGKDYIVAVTTSFDENTTFAAEYEGIWVTGSTQSFELTDVPSGSYYLFAVIDWNNDGDYNSVFPNFAGLYNYNFDDLASLIDGGDAPGPANLTVADADVTADITDIQQIPAPLNGTITVNIENAEAQEGKYFGFAVFEDDNIVLEGQVAEGFDIISAAGTAGSIAYIDLSVRPPIEYTATGGDIFDIHIMIDMNDNGITDIGDYVGIIEDVYINGDATVTADYNIDLTEYVPPDRSILVSLTGAESDSGNILIFAVYPEGAEQGPDNYIAAGGFLITEDGTGADMAFEKENTESVFIATTGVSYDILVFVDRDENGMPDTDEPIKDDYSVTIDGATTLDVIYDDLQIPVM